MVKQCGRLYGELVDQFRGPILVIGGGPSALKELPELVRLGLKPLAVLSANEHGHLQEHFEVTHTVSADGVHHEKHKRMDKLLAQYGTQPHISPVFFADYRLPDWILAANTGLTAIAVALGMGGSPVVVTGLDFYRWKHPGAATYFHDPDGVSNSNNKLPVNFMQQIRALYARIGSPQPVRPLSGPLLEHYRAYNPEEKTPPATLYEYARFCHRMETHVCTPHRSLPWTLHGMQVDRGLEVPCSPLEARAGAADRRAVLLRVIPSPLERARLATQGAAGVESAPVSLPR